jgi:TPR repeat protein
MTCSCFKRRPLLMGAVALCALFIAMNLSKASTLKEAKAALDAGEYQSAIQLFELLAERGDVSAQYSLGSIYSRGFGTSKNFTVAARWFRKAAVQGHTEAQFDLGALYHRGEGVRKNSQLAIEWWLKSANAGDAFAQSGLGDLYLDGNGVNRDLVQAYKWKMLSEPRLKAGQVPWGALGIRNLAKQLTPSQLGAGQREVRKWIAAQRAKSGPKH